MAARRSSNTTPAPIKIDRAPRPDLVTRQELAEILRVSDRYVDRLIERNAIPYAKVGRYCRFRFSDVEEYLDSCRVPAATDRHVEVIDF